MTRAFIAIEPPLRLRQDLAAYLRENLDASGQIRRVRPENMHITIKFLGAIDSLKLKNTSDLLGSISLPGFNIRVKGFGAFPPKKAPRILWAGLSEGFDETKSIQRTIDKILSMQGFEKDTRFHPHITLARLRSTDPERIHRFLNENKEKEFEEFRVKEIKLIESILGKDGPTYHTLNTGKLG